MVQEKRVSEIELGGACPVNHGGHGDQQIGGAMTMPGHPLCEQDITMRNKLKWK